MVPACQAVLFGAEPSFEVGAALAIPFLTAHRCLTVAESLPDRMSRGPSTATRFSACRLLPGGQAAHCLWSAVGVGRGSRSAET